MNFSLYIAKRYLRSKSSNNAINFITILAVIGIVLGAASLFIVLSGFAGLKNFTLEYTTIIDPDLKAETTIGKSFILNENIEAKLQAIPGIAMYSKVIEERVFSSFDGKPYPAYIKGVDENYERVNTVDSILIQGSWVTQKTSQIVVGRGIANSLSLGVLDYGKRVSLFVPKPGKGQITSTKDAFKQVQSVNVGIFFINEKLNDSYIFSSIDLARELLDYSKNQISSVEFKLHPDADEAQVKAEIQSVLGDKISVKNRAQLNDALYKMLNTENLVVYLIFTLVLIIALFNVIGSIIMMILDKKATLNTLFNLGATVKDIRRIFFLQGTLMTLVGGTIGLGIGLIVIVLQSQFSLVMLTPSLPYPVDIRLDNLIIVFLTITVLGILASKIASVRISKNLVKTS
ncbi:FtsX-like permease family protein [Bizionia paragorgiae]|uniref:Lipoprotein-releasing system permease protein n=1 Tax=Bizionia paragorgiae TaxID=283786 RepID=A0A1H3W6L5_BIZPA|nr:FtsX-like permease family protein [Bizionia paragorgiae]MDX1270231.1 FtsX-like permease family protein [Bizionia paragorgiae]SDZ82064.1 lipoprotein-releasing system permease protein [Bizionia paragorgiae]